MCLENAWFSSWAYRSDLIYSGDSKYGAVFDWLTPIAWPCHSDSDLIKVQISNVSGNWIVTVLRSLTRVSKSWDIIFKYNVVQKPRCLNFFYFYFILVSRGAFPTDEWEYEPARPLVVTRTNLHSYHHGRMADETSQEILRGQEIGLKTFKRPLPFSRKLEIRIFCVFSSRLWSRTLAHYYLAQI